ncbi:hypothetical protein JZ751_015152 [Albula glossodonta]|uniref:Prolactin n=1 Tax=Albula glossodonta TaxID=121402 RepID=A0A8T2NTT8_9TELE|nr:hypothetical protein JZ751_015152 [Albula glossodonta]
MARGQTGPGKRGAMGWGRDSMVESLLQEQEGQAQAQCHAVGLNDLLERLSQLSEKLHVISTSMTNDLDSHFPPMGKIMMPRPSKCHTASLQTPNDKDQALKVPESELLSLVRALLVSWNDPLLLLSSEAPTLSHPYNAAIYTQSEGPGSSGIQHLDHSRTVKEHSINHRSGLWLKTDILFLGRVSVVGFVHCSSCSSTKIGTSSRPASALPFRGSDLGSDKNSRLINFHFLLSCFRRDSHKIDSFLKLLRCRAAKQQPEMC